MVRPMHIYCPKGWSKNGDQATDFRDINPDRRRTGDVRANRRDLRFDVLYQYSETHQSSRGDHDAKRSGHAAPESVSRKCTGQVHRKFNQALYKTP